MVTTTICATTLRRCHLPILSLGPLLTHQTSFGPPLAAIPSIMDRQADSTPVVVSRPYSKAIVAVAMALSLAVSALATAGPAAAQWRGERDGRWWGSMSTAAPWSSSRHDGREGFLLERRRLLLAGSANLFHLRRLARQPAGQRLPLGGLNRFRTAKEASGPQRGAVHAFGQRALSRETRPFKVKPDIRIETLSRLSRPLTPQGPFPKSISTRSE